MALSRIMASMVNFTHALLGGTRRTLQDKLQDVVSVKDFGAIGNGVTDDTAAVKAAMAWVASVGGGTLYFPRGTYLVTDELLVQTEGIRFVGSGRRKVYPGLFSPSANCHSTILPVHSKTATIRVFSPALNSASAFSMADINIATVESGAVPICAIGFHGAGNFQRDFTFERVGIHGFTSAFDTYGTGGDTAFGTLKVNNCAINRNSYISRNLTGQWNSFTFEKNEAGQNLVGGIDLKAQVASIRSNSLEGQPNTIKVTGNYRGIEIGGNYFESNSGAYVIRLQETLGAVINPNFWQTITATERISLINDIDTTNNDRCVASTLGSVNYRSAGAVIDPVPLGSASVMLGYQPLLLKSLNMNGAAFFDGYQTTAPELQHPAIEGSAAQKYTSTGSGLMTFTKTGLSYPSGTYISVAILVSYVDTPSLPPRMELRVNSTNTAGYTNPTFYNFNKAYVDLKNKTVLYYGVVRATADVTSMQFFCYPFGLNPAAGLVCGYSMPVMSQLGSTIPSVQDVGSAVEVGIAETHVKMVSAIPTVGTWLTGWRLKYRAPTTYEGAVCIQTGTPGVWRHYGALVDPAAP